MQLSMAASATAEPQQRVCGGTPFSCLDGPDLFRVEEKRYRWKASFDSAPSTNRSGRRRHKQQRLQQDFSDVIDLHRLSNNTTTNAQRIVARKKDSQSELRDEARVWNVDGCDGLTIITHALSDDEQLHWARECLASYSNAAHTNLSALNGPQPNHWAEAASSGEWMAFHQLHWASLGYHYNWTQRTYAESQYSTFPPALAALSTRFSSALSLELTPSAALVNYYSLQSSMLAHVDNAELSMLPPIVSLSLGQSAIFLLGAETKTVKPTAVWLRSGDVLVMGGPSRRCYHGVPRVLKERQWSGREDDDTEMSCVRRYLDTHRINVNIRQVEDAQHTFASSHARGDARVGDEVASGDRSSHG
ncbi:Nucleic acid dioxygenase alkbh1 [Xylographa carneopallida]|nr:Nucleic acid dioxygenase alkbh1 [Xylographa carneopallida]